jgi:hypothetical protein
MQAHPSIAYTENVIRPLRSSPTLSVWTFCLLTQATLELPPALRPGSESVQPYEWSSLPATAPRIQLSPENSASALSGIPKLGDDIYVYAFLRDGRGLVASRVPDKKIPLEHLDAPSTPILATHRTLLADLGVSTTARPLDSVAALVPKAEIEGEMGDQHMGLQARLMSQALRKLTGILSKSNCAMIFINQLRMKIGVMFGNPETTTGGNALKFYASVRLDIRRIAALKDGESVIGNRTRVKVVKNKLAPPFREVEFDILYGKGISKMGDLLDAAATHGIVEKSGTWFTYKDERMGQGRDNARQWLEDHQADAKKIRDEVLKKSGVKVAPGSTAAAAEPVKPDAAKLAAEKANLAKAQAAAKR